MAIKTVNCIKCTIKKGYFGDPGKYKLFISLSVPKVPFGCLLPPECGGCQVTVSQFTPHRRKDILILVLLKDIFYF